MNHLKVYNSIIDNARLRQINNPIKGYKEVHHILPRCLGGDDEPYYHGPNPSNPKINSENSKCRILSVKLNNSW